MTSKVFIYTIPRDSAYGIHNWVDPNSGAKLEKTKVGTAKTKLTALYSQKVGGLLNGLSYKPWEEGGKIIQDSLGKDLTLQQKEETKWGLDAGYLTNRAWRRGDSLNPEKMTYYQLKTWTLKDGATVLDLSNFDDLMFYYVCLDSKFVANSEREWKARKWPYATHYIAITNEGEEIIHERNSRKIKAISMLGDSSLSSAKKKEIIWVLGLQATTAAISDEGADNMLFRYIESDSMLAPTTSKFIEVASLLKDEKGRIEFAARLLLKKALDTRVIYEKSDTYTWNRAKGSIVLGDRYAEAIDFLTNPKKDGLVIELEQEIKAKLL